MDNNQQKEPSGKNVLKILWDFIHYRIDLHGDKEDEEKTIESIKKGIVFRGINVWILAFAIIIASVGLNVNSTAVIIGAMLISPLMGPIMGAGLAIGINDFSLLKRSGKNLAIATVIGLVSSTAYFFITPLGDASSELLNRTSPTLYDVLIAFFGGLAGIVAGSSKEKGTVIPGVAIATALMPPLCTAGYGLASGQMYYFFGAFYLYIINCVFICLATFLIVRYLNYEKVHLQDVKLEKKARNWITFIALVTIIPSVILAWVMISNTVLEKRINNFVVQYFELPDVNIIKKEIKREHDTTFIEVSLYGKILEEEYINQIRIKMKEQNFGLVRLLVNQGANATSKLQNEDISNILDKVYQQNKEAVLDKDKKIEYLEKQLYTYKLGEFPVEQLSRELKVSYPSIKSFSIKEMVFAHYVNDTLKTDTITAAIIKTSQDIPAARKTAIGEFLKVRLEKDTVAVYYF
jgi:uncharacterized hydrophobic protein (TIGR00271 family)